MNSLQLALLAIVIPAAIALWWFSRRKRDVATVDQSDALMQPAAQQMDMFRPGAAPAPAANPASFDEFGVGKARPAARREPKVSVPPAAETFQIALILVERTGTPIPGNRLHSSLKSTGLIFGAGQWYHRQEQGRSMFTVANLTKPGVLNPADTHVFSTKGLIMHLQLPGPADPDEAFHDFVSTAQHLANALNCEVLTVQKQPLSDAEVQMMGHALQSWRLQHGV